MKTLCLLAIIALCLLAGCSSTQSVPTNQTLKFVWTAPGDDGLFTGRASGYEMRTAADSLTLKNNWASCQIVPGMPVTPALAGTKDSATVTLSLETQTYYFYGLKVRDEVPNWSPVSNIVWVIIPDSTAPGKLTDLTVQRL